MPIPNTISSNPIVAAPADVPNMASARVPPVHAENPNNIIRAGVPYAIATPSKLVAIIIPPYFLYALTKQIL